MGSKDTGGFPDAASKLAALPKKSVFERQRAEAEAKRLREEAETAAVYEDFVKSFDQDDTSGHGASRSGGGQYGAPPDRSAGRSDQGTRGGFGGGRHFGRGGGMVNSGPGSLGPPPMSMVNKKRNFDGFAQGFGRGARSAPAERGLLAFDDGEDDVEASKPAKLSRLDAHEDEHARGSREEERAVAKPTIKLASLPPGSSPAFVKSIVSANLVVDNVRILPPTGPGSQTERKSLTAIVTLAKDTAATDIDTAVNSLQNKYLGFGFYLELHRHLSSTAITAATAVSTSSSHASSRPFGARPAALPAAARGGPTHHHRGFAPPTDYGPPGPQASRGGVLHVAVQPPSDLRELKLIHKTIEAMLTHGPEFEALLMSRQSVQREEKWAWLWDARSTGGVWYRWRLWEILTGTKSRRGQGKYLPLFEDSSAWKQPDNGLAFEYTTKLEEFVSESEYLSSDEDDSGDEGRPRAAGEPDAEESQAYLTPLQKARLAHLLARLPTSTGRLRKGDVARVTAFAIAHAGKGADEVVSSIVSNIERPFAFTSANAERRKEKESHGDSADDDSDISSACLIGIFLISDILSSSSTSGVRHAWRYRQLFEQELRRRRVFERLGRMERKLNWGRLRAEKWKRSVTNILSLWDGWCVFPQTAHDHFVAMFNNPPLTLEEQREAQEKEVLDNATRDKAKTKWRAVDRTADGSSTGTDTIKGAATPDEHDDDVDGEPMDEDDDVDGEPMVEDDDDDDNGEMDGEPMAPTEDEPLPHEPPPTPPPPETAAVDPAPVSHDPVPCSVPPTQRRPRPKAVDMFADSDGEDA